MSEHIKISGLVSYLHLPYDEEGAFTFCHHCKKTMRTAIIELHEGDYIIMKCPKCKKSIWFALLTNNKDTFEKGFKNNCLNKEGRTLIFDNHKCICGKPTNRFDCYSYTYNEKNKLICYCSKKCESMMGDRK